MTAAQQIVAHLLETDEFGDLVKDVSDPDVSFLIHRSGTGSVYADAPFEHDFLVYSDDKAGPTRTFEGYLRQRGNRWEAYTRRKETGKASYTGIFGSTDSAAHSLYQRNRTRKRLPESEEDDFDLKDVAGPPMEFRLTHGYSHHLGSHITDAIYRDGQVEYQNDYRGHWFPVLHVEYEGRHYTGKRLKKFEQLAYRKDGGPAVFTISDGNYTQSHYQIFPARLRS